MCEVVASIPFISHAWLIWMSNGSPSILLPQSPWYVSILITIFITHIKWFQPQRELVLEIIDIITKPNQTKYITVSWSW